MKTWVDEALNVSIYAWSTYFFNLINNYSLYYLLLGCCIFHKTRKFVESDSDESDSDTEIAKQEPPKKGRPPAYQRHHA